VHLLNRPRIAVLAWLAAAVMSGCGREAPPQATGKLVVAVGVLPYKWLVEQIGGDHVEVIALVKPGDSAELYQPTDSEVTRLVQAAVYFRTGMPFENGPWLGALQANPNIRLADLLAGIKLRPMESHAHGEAAGTTPQEPAGAGDPHVWLSPRLLKIQAQTVAGQLESLDPKHAKDYQKNLAELDARLDRADQSIRRMLAPLRGKVMFVFHPAWGYFADEYGLRQVAIQAEGKEPTDQELTELQKLARQEGAKVIFVQPQFAAGAARAVARTVGARVETLDDLAPDAIAGLLEAAANVVEGYR
jgi:zinc transport system substrate-binding protein